MREYIVYIFDDMTCELGFSNDVLMPFFIQGGIVLSQVIVS